MPNYIVTHWRGQQSLLISVLVNGLGAYIVLVLLLATLGGIVAGQSFQYLGIGIFCAWFIWATVGIVRCALRAMFNRQSMLWQKIGGGAALLGVMVVTISTIRDIIRLGEIYFGA